MVDAQAVHDPLTHELQHLLVGCAEHLVVLLAHARELVDVEETPMAAGDGIDVEEAPAQAFVDPEAVLLAGGHVVRHDVDDHAEPCGGQLAQTPLAAELLRDAARVDDVVAAHRARTRLEHGREVEVTHAQLAQVGHERARLCEAQPAPELETVGGAQRGQPCRPTSLSMRHRAARRHELASGRRPGRRPPRGRARPSRARAPSARRSGAQAA